MKIRFTTQLPIPLDEAGVSRIAIRYDRSVAPVTGRVVVIVPGLAAIPLTDAIPAGEIELAVHSGLTVHFPPEAVGLHDWLVRHHYIADLAEG